MPKHIAAFTCLPCAIRIRAVKTIYFLVAVVMAALTGDAVAQPPPRRNPDVSNKALITKSTPSIDTGAFKNQSSDATPAALRKMADDYYTWRNENYPVRS